MTDHTQSVDVGTDYETTESGLAYTRTGNRIVIPDVENDYGGGVALTTDAVSAIIACPVGGSRVDGQINWEYTGRRQHTRVGASKIVRVTQTSFGRERAIEASIVQLADADLESGIVGTDP